MCNFERLEETKESREKAVDARYHAQEMALALEVYYWTGDNFHYHEAVKHFESLACEMEEFQNLKKGGK